MRSGRPLAWLVAVGGGAMLAGLAAVHATADADARSLAGHLAAIVATTAAVMCSDSAARRGPAATRRFWLAFCAMCVLALLAEVGYAALALDEVPPAVPSAADIAYVLAVIPGIAAFLILAMVGRGRSRRLRPLVDAVALASSLLFVVWSLILRDHYPDAGDLSSGALVGLAFPLVDVLLVALVLPVLGRARRRSLPSLAMLTAGLLVLATTDLLLLEDGLARASSAGTGVGTGVPGAFLLLALGAALADRAAMPTQEEPGSAALMLPQLLALGAVGVFLLRLTTGEEFDVVEIALVSLVSLASTVRLGLMLSENNALTQEVRAAMADVQASEERFRSIVQGSSDFITVCDATGRVTYQSQSRRPLPGLVAARLMGREVIELIHPDDRERALRQYRESLGTPGPTLFECRVGTAGGEWRHVEAVVTNLLDDPNVRGIVINTRDVTEHKQLERRLAHQALHDPLSGLPNRALFRDRVHHGLALQKRDSAESGRLAVLFIDLDGFAAVNDSLGHAAGDAVLMLTASRLVECVRPGDTASRLGGDEFAVLLENVASRAVATSVAARFLKSMQDPMVLDGRELYISASIGVALDSAGDGAEELLRNADLAMNRAKERGRRRYEVFEPDMHAAARRRLDLETDLRRALERGELFCLYQPVVELQTGLLAGVEALVRWRHPTRGVVPPAMFINAAEETGLIVPLGRWVLDEACRQISAWQRVAGRPLGLSVNLSAGQLDDPGLADDVLDALAAADVDPSSLVLEITESMLVDDADGSFAKAQQLSDLGVGLAIDDFGTGYSSLAYLSRLPVDILKIDKSFVAALVGEDETAAVTSAIVAMGKSLDLAIVAEGIEEIAQLDALVALGCDYGQGYLLAPPLESDEIEALLTGGDEAAVLLPRQAEPARRAERPVG